LSSRDPVPFLPVPFLPAPFLLAPCWLVLGVALLLAACQASEEEPRAAAPAAPASTAATVSQPSAASASALASPGSADAAVKASMQRFVAARSFHAVMTLEGAQSMTTTMEFQAPDRYRLSMPAGTQTIIGDVMYMQVQGRTTRVPLAEDVLGQWRDPLRMEQSAQAMTATAQGSETIDGVPARKYLVRHGPPDETEITYWIGADDLPLQLRHSGQSADKPYSMTLRYSRFDDPSITIDAPR